MTISVLPPVNILSTGGGNPLAGNNAFAAPDQIRYLGVYNSTVNQLNASTPSQTKIIYPNNADVLVVDGATPINLGVPASGVYNLASNYPSPTILGVCLLTIYDQTEDFPQGFPYTLPNVSLGTFSLVAWEYQSPTTGFYFQVQQGTSVIVIGPGAATSATIVVTGAESGNVYYSGSIANEISFDVRNPIDNVFKVVPSGGQPVLTIYSSTEPINPIPSELLDTSGNGGYLITTGNVNLPPSTWGAVFGTGLSIGTGYAQTNSGTSIKQGAIGNSPGWDIRFRYVPSAYDIAASGGCFIIGRISPAEWQIYISGSTLVFVWWDSTNTVRSIAAANVCVAGVPLAVEVEFSGAEIYLLVNGILVGSSVTNLTFLTPVNQPLTLGDPNVPTQSFTGIIDELEIAGNIRHAVIPYLVEAGPIVPDGFTGLLYHFDVAEPDWSSGAVSWTVTVPNPAAGGQWTYTLPAPARLRSLVAVFTAVGAAANRFPYVALLAGTPNAGEVPLAPSAITAGVGLIINAFPGAPLQIVASSPEMGTAALPDIILPAGSTINSLCQNMQTTDTWTNIFLTFTAA
jgi:hypothetical protein